MLCDHLVFLVIIMILLYNIHKRNYINYTYCTIAKHKRTEVFFMNERAKELRRAYKREWNRKNPDKVKAAQTRYWERKAAATAPDPEELPTDEPKQEV